MHYHEIFVGKGAKEWSERFPIVFEKNVDGYRSVALPPPRGSQIQEQFFQLAVLYAAKIVYGSDPVVAILHHTYVFIASIDAQSDERISIT